MKLPPLYPALCYCICAGVLAQTASAPESAAPPGVPQTSPQTAPQTAPSSAPTAAPPPASAAKLPRVVPDASGGAEAAAAFRRLPVCTLAPDGKRLLTEPCRPAPSRTPGQRRAVPQAIDRVPPPSYGYRPPTAAPALPAPPAPAVQGTTAPQPILGCDAGGCRDAGGTRYQGGTGNVVLDPAGRQCTRNGAWVQCF